MKNLINILVSVRIFNRHDDMEEQMNDIATFVMVLLIVSTALMTGYMAWSQEWAEPAWWLEFEKMIGITW